MDLIALLILIFVVLQVLGFLFAICVVFIGVAYVIYRTLRDSL